MLRDCKKAGVWLKNIFIKNIENINDGKCPICDSDIELVNTADKDIVKYYCDICDGNWILTIKGSDRDKLVYVDENYFEYTILHGSQVKRFFVYGKYKS